MAILQGWREQVVSVISCWCEQVARSWLNTLSDLNTLTLHKGFLCISDFSSFVRGGSQYYVFNIIVRG